MIISWDKNDVCYRNYEDFSILYNTKTTMMYLFENVAMDIWNIITRNAETDVKFIVKELLFLYECNKKDLIKDIHEFIEELYQEGNIKINGIYNENNINYMNTKLSIEPSIEQDIIKLLNQRDQLYSFTMEMTYNCNEKCLHCYAYNNDKIKKITVEKYYDVIDQLYDLKCMKIAFTGGDPFLNPCFMDVYKYARKKGFMCEIFTNGQYLSDNHNVLNDLIKFNPRNFYISLYGPDAATHDYITTIKGSFDKTIDTIKILVDNNVPVVANIIILNINAHKAKSTINLAKQLNIKYRVGFSIIYANDGSNNPMKYFLKDKSIIKEIIRYNSNTDKISIPQNSNIRICGAGLTVLSMSPVGEIFPCVSLKNKLGNIYEQTLKEIWESKERKKLAKSLIWSNTHNCSMCKNRSFCQHCLAISAAEKNDIFSCNTCDKFISDCIDELIKEEHIIDKE